MPRRRRTRTTLRGWMRGLPPLGMCFGVMFLFTWLEVERLNNEYRAQELAGEIIGVKAGIAKLQEQSAHLERMERMAQEAPSLSLTEPDPHQIVIIRGGPRRETPTPANSQFAGRTLLPARSVVFHLGPPDDGNVATTVQHEIARMESDQGPPD